MRFPLRCQQLCLPILIEKRMDTINLLFSHITTHQNLDFVFWEGTPAAKKETVCLNNCSWISGLRFFFILSIMKNAYYPLWTTDWEGGTLSQGQRGLLNKGYETLWGVYGFYGLLACSVTRKFRTHSLQVPISHKLRDGDTSPCLTSLMHAQFTRSWTGKWTGFSWISSM